MNARLPDPAPDCGVDVLRMALLNPWQRGFPLQERPFEAIADGCGMRSSDVLAGYRRLAADGALSRIGGVWAAGVGGAAVLCAMQVPPVRLDEVALRVSAQAGVNHNYEREHALNLWFVITGRDADAVESGVQAIEGATGLAALRLPMQRVYRINLGFDLRRRDADAALAALVEEGLPLVERPYDAWAQALGATRDAVLGTLQRWLEQGTLRRFGAIVRHHELGFDQNAMTVFDVPDDQVDACGAALAQQGGVTLCYRRARAVGWPYNLYCMVHGRERGTVQAAIRTAMAEAGLLERPHAVLFSRRRFKQVGARYFRALPVGAEHAIT
jgi:DNA-binding Lrp family transcriptional regulator